MTKTVSLIGWDNTVLKSYNGILSLDLSGDRCPDNTESGITVRFICDYSALNGNYNVNVVSTGIIKGTFVLYQQNFR